MLRRILLASAGAMALAGPALAADLLRAPPPPPPPPPPPMWTGLFVGLNAGYTWTSSTSVDTQTADVFGNPGLVGGPQFGVTSAALATTNVPVNTNGFIGGGQWGYNYQFGTSWVAGFESDIQGIASGNHSVNEFSQAVASGFPGFPIDQNVSAHKSFGFLATDRVRLGFLVTPTLLLYGTGGLAYGTADMSTSITQIVANAPAIPNPYSSFGNFDHVLAGWTAGGGLEWLFAPNWSVKVEYLYYDLGSVSYTMSPLVNFNTTPDVFTLGAPTAHTRFNGNIVRAGIDYHINWFPAPVVAKY